MIVLFFTAVILVGFLVSANAQNPVVGNNYSFCLADPTGHPVKQASVRVNRKSGTLIRFFNLRDTSCATILLPSEFDTIVFLISSPGFLPFEKRQAVHNTYPETETLSLEWAPASLPGAEVRASRWVRGDTTFFNPEAYATGEEKKLKELLEKLPDFRIDENGVMRYKNRPI